MPPTEPKLTARALQPFVSGLRAMGHDPEPLMEAAGLSMRLLSDPDARVPMRRVLELLRDAVAHTGDDNLGLHLAERAELGAFDAPFYAMHASATLGGAYQRLCRYQRLIHDTTRVELRIEDDRARLRHVFPGGRAAPRQTAEFLLAAWVRAGRAVTGVDWNPAEVHFAHAEPASTREHARLLRAPLRFAAVENALVLPTTLLELPCTNADPVLAALLDRFAADRAAGTSAPETFTDRVGAALEAELPSGGVTAAAVAARLRISVRSLNRHLAAEGTSYRALLAFTRHRLAERLLADRSRSIAEIGFDLGFSDLSAFYRAFRRWTGHTPAQHPARRRS